MLVTHSGEACFYRKPAVPHPLPEAALSLLEEKGVEAFPAIARNPRLTNWLAAAARDQTTTHRLFLGDSREKLAELPENTVHLAITSPPYWTLKTYEHAPGQIGAIQDYEAFLEALDEVWRAVFRLLVPGGRLIVVVGDVTVPRRDPVFKRHLVLPLHAAIQEHGRKIGFDNLTPIIWHKITNARFEAKGGRFLGKPYEPGAIIKNDIEYILFLRKPGGYRKPTLEQRLLSIIPESEHRKWFQPIWQLAGTPARDHPAPFPLTLAERLVRMFSFVGDTVLDPFMGSGTTNLAALRWGRNSVGVELVERYWRRAIERIQAAGAERCDAKAQSH